MDQEEEDIEGMMEELASFYCSGMDDDDLRVFRDAIDSNRYVITINCSEFYEFPPLFQEKVTNGKMNIRIQTTELDQCQS
mmetsp:Transcript_3505/g.5469  ORF Transcript_3505/g.5469 Transcript_3505/m.5469 type:complete len:80 (-) Transcript_3505:377-616(-)